MRFLIAFLRNLAILIVAGLLLLALFPDIMKAAYQVLGALFGPLALLFVIIAALPGRRRRY